MGRHRALFALALTAALVLTTTGPAAAAPCAERCACPMMAKMDRAMPCHTGVALAAPMDCCRPKAAPATPAPTLVAPVSVDVATVAVSDSVAPPPLPDVVAAPAALRASQHQLGLFTLHSIWRI